MNGLLTDLPAGAVLSSVVVSCSNAESFAQTLKAFGVVDGFFNGAFASRMITLDLGAVAVTVELAEMGSSTEKGGGWMSRFCS
jgi:hypothetical protein